MKIFFPFMFIATALLFNQSCSKEQLALNKIAGNWSMISVNDNGTVFPMVTDEQIWSFQKCSAKDNYCDIIMKNNTTGTTQNSKYKLNDSATKLYMQNSTTHVDDVSDITELTKSRLSIKISLPGYYQIISFRKK